MDGRTDSPPNSAGPRDRSAAGTGRRRDTGHGLPCAAKGDPKFLLPGAWGGAAPPLPAAPAGPALPGCSRAPHSPGPALPPGVLCTATAGRGALPDLGREMRETTCFQVNHPRWKRRDQSYAGTARKGRAGILEKLPPTPNGASSRGTPGL